MLSHTDRIPAQPRSARAVRADAGAGRLMLLTLGFAGLTAAGLVVSIVSILF